MSSPFVPEAYLGGFMPARYLGGHAYPPGPAPPAPPAPSPPPFVFASGPYVPPGYLGGFVPMGYLGLSAPRITPYRAPAPTGWKSSGRRTGPDPDMSTGTRTAGDGS